MKANPGLGDGLARVHIDDRPILGSRLAIRTLQKFSGLCVAAKYQGEDTSVALRKGGNNGSHYRIRNSGLGYSAQLRRSAVLVYGGRAIRTRSTRTDQVMG